MEEQTHSHPVLSQQRKRTACKLLPIFGVCADSTNEMPSPTRPVAIIPANSVTVIVVNFKTEELLKRCLGSFLSHYPDVRVLLWDNGSDDGSTEWAREAGDRYGTVTPILSESNIGHGPAMNEAIHRAGTRYVFTMDTDCQTIRGGFLEEMLNLFQGDDALYALGWLRHVDWSTGVPAPSPEGFMPYVHPSAAMYDRQKYLTLYPFVHQGAPATRNMREALEAGYSLRSFPIHEYVTHLEAGTRRMYGGRWNPGKGELPGPWQENARHPI